jgi:mono/diheme cytochrome c family protein
VVGQDRGRGAALYAKNCSVCHDAGAGSRIGPSLEHIGHRLSLEQIESVIEVPDPPMPKLYPSVLTQQDVDDIAAYVKTL